MDHGNLYQPSSRIAKHIRISIFEEITMLSLQNQCITQYQISSIFIISR